MGQLQMPSLRMRLPQCHGLINDGLQVKWDGAWIELIASPNRCFQCGGAVTQALLQSGIQARQLLIGLIQVQALRL